MPESVKKSAIRSSGCERRQETPQRIDGPPQVYQIVIHMRDVISISLQPELTKRLNKSIKANKTTRSEIVKKALTDYFHNEEMAAFRGKLRPLAEKAGYFTDEDVFRVIS